MSLVSLGEARGLVSTSLTDTDLQAVINREEAWLARRVGPLTGARTQRFWIRDVDRDDPLALRRPTSTLGTVSDFGTVIVAGDLRLLGDGTLVERAKASWGGPWVDVTYTPNDEEEAKRVVIELIRLTASQTTGSFEAERIGDYSYQRGSAATVGVMRREDLARALQPHAWRARTIRLRSSVAPERIGDLTP